MIGRHKMKTQPTASYLRERENNESIWLHLYKYIAQEHILLRCQKQSDIFNKTSQIMRV